ncbi:MAG: vWA domain-containing protein [Deltaproteobacteria bacterium]
MLRTRSILAACAVGAFCACQQQHLYATPPPGTVIDSFAQKTVAKTDILWVVDSSGSMAAEQSELAESFPKFFAHLDAAQLDFRIAVTTMAVLTPDGQPLATAGQLVGNPAVIVGGSQDPAVSDTPNPQAAFEANILVGTSGSARDEGLEATADALSYLQSQAAAAEASGKPILFLRPDASLFIILVTDGVDYSPDEPRYYWRLYQQAKGIGNEGLVTVSGIVSEPPNGCNGNPPGIRYYEVVEMSGGVAGSVCDPSFDTALDQLGFAAVGLTRKFYLSQPPDPSSLQVTVNYPCGTPDPANSLLCTGGINSSCPSGYGSQCTASCDTAGLACPPPEDPQNGWSYEASDNAILFAGQAIPALGATVQITYTLGAGPLP